MGAKILSGKEVAASLDGRSAAEVEALKGKGVTPKLAIVRMGERASDLSYERGATKRCAAAGIEVENVVLSADAPQDELMAAIGRLNGDAGVHGVLMFRPLPGQVDEKAACEALEPAKDVDGMTRGSLSTVFAGRGAGYAPCTARAVMEILRHYGIETRGKRAVVIGRSLVIGRPVAMLLMHADATVTICHTKTVDVPSISRGADIVVVAAGQMEGIGAEYFEPGAGQVVIDVGIGWNEATGKLCGDVAFDEVEPLVGAITPVPGGVGAVTTSVLCRHVVEAARSRLGG